MIRARVNMQAYPRLRTQNEALRLTTPDYRGPILVEFGQLHRKQMTAAFTTQGASTPGGRWAELNPSYAKRKRKVAPGRKILVLSGDMRARFTKAHHPAYVQEYVPRTDTAGVFRFGARSDVAAAHLYGNPALARKGSSALARKIFGGIAPRLPVRGMIAKTAAQSAEFSALFAAWYRKRVAQVLRHFGPSLRDSRPR